MSGKRRDLTGMKFGKLAVDSYYGKNKHSQNLWRCFCECGSERFVASTSLLTGKTVSCGCHRVAIFVARNTTHGMSRSREYCAWEHMISRCYNPENDRFSDYGGRGISVCSRWMDFENFLEDMGVRPDGTSIDRYPNNDGNYEPGNCRWATVTEQQRNMRSNRVIEHDGKILCLSEWADVLGINVWTIASRLARGWSIQRALSK